MNCSEGVCDGCGKTGKFAYCVAPSPIHLHACDEKCLVHVSERAQKERASGQEV